MGQYLENLTWDVAESLLAGNPLVLLPIGARLKEHGLHLPLNNDFILAEYLTRRLLGELTAVAVPTVPYGYYPAFVEYPGSVHIARETFRDLICDIARSLARHGGRRIYAVNTGVSTNWSLEPARLLLQDSGIQFEFSDLHQLLPPIVDPLRQQPRGTHADEIETSMMLYIQPAIVNLARAQRDIDPRRERGRLTRNPETDTGVYSPTGAWGDPTLATVAKGEQIVEQLVVRLLDEIRRFDNPEYVPPGPRRNYLE